MKYHSLPIHSLRFFTIILSSLLFDLCASGGAESAPPNIVVVMTDDQGWGDLSVHGNTNLNTPNIDRLAQDGAAFNRFYVTPVCSPTRAEFLTGRYHPRSSVSDTGGGGERMDLDEQTIGEVFQSSGYATGVFGKWHNGMQHPYHPNSRGFDEFYGFCSGHWGHYFDPLLEHNGEIVRGNGFIIDDLTDKAMDYIESQSGEQRPFFVFMAYNTPHAPMQVPERFWRKFENADLGMFHRDPDKENIQHTRAALAMCENIDWNVGRLMGKIDTLGLSQNTIFIYLSDNGPNGFRWNAGLKGKKGSTDEGGVRSPLFIKWPEKIQPGKQITSISSAIDLLPTLAELAQLDYTPAKPLDGLSQAPALLKKNYDAPDRMIFTHWYDMITVRTQRFLLDHEGVLYDITADPEQTTPVTNDHPEVTASLKSAITNWRTTVLAESRDGRPFIICHPDAPMTQLPARDGVAHGNIRRSNRWPNSSYFHNWIDEADSITWDVEVATPGEYVVTLYYACPEEDIGSTIELKMGEHRVQAKITEAHDPPLLGPEADRVPRPSSYEKDFKPIEIGTISLPAGPSTLTLSAPEIPGSQAIEFRLLLLRPVRM